MERYFPEYFGRKGKPVEKAKMIFQQQEEIERYWTELLWMLSGESKSEYDTLKGTEVMEFFRILKVHHANLKRKTNGKHKS